MTPGLSACTRCGKVRIVTKTYREHIGDSWIVTNLTSCPDTDCQAIVDKQLAKEQKFRDEMALAGERRLKEAKERRSQKTSQKTP
jgi:hypothetical protein